MVLVALTAFRTAPDISNLLLQADNDDQMRLVEVRDLLSGQSWWDTRQYRVLPPEGISLHWSRYIDAGIASIILVASTIVPTSSAELVAVILWPSFLACLMILVLARGTARLLGTASAIGAVAVFLSWSKLGGEFVPPRIDHHNVQILCGTAVFYLALLPGRPWVLGALGGVVTAFSLAIGLELLPYFATIWGLMALRHAFGQSDTGSWLVGFGGAITLSAPLFMAGQIPVSAWGTPWCDALATPVMALGLVGVAATLTPVLAHRILTGPLTRITALLTVTALGLWLAFPLLGQCLAGPYSSVGPEVRSVIDSSIVEAQSVSTLLMRDPALLAWVLLPPLVITLLALLAYWPARGRINPRQGTALLQAFVVIGVGFGVTLWQIRATNLMAPAIPFLAGFLVYGFTLIPRESWLRLPAVIILLLAVPAVVERVANWLTPVSRTAISAKASSDPAPAFTNCRTKTAMAEIGRLPPALMFPTINLGSTIIAYTHHASASAAYHRNVDAFLNGSSAFLSETSLRTAVAKSGADYVLLCANSRPERGNPWTVALLAGELPDWLTDVTVDRSEVRLLKVDKSLLKSASP